MSQENIDRLEIVRQVTAAFNRRDLEAFATLSTPDVQIEPMRSAIDGKVYTGESAAQEFVEDSADSWQDLSVEVTEVRSHGDKALVLGTIRGRGRESGAEVETELFGVVEFREGLVASFRTYLHQGEALVAMGRRT